VHSTVEVVQHKQQCSNIAVYHCAYYLLLLLLLLRLLVLSLLLASALPAVLEL
jgi:hypothetical protein